ncbi:MAG: hypothetical protein JJU05_10715 [Verrucomicrobia bacterium]|nr:hypothetical protein [Verrucomicrobiota bacterium]MCH8528629.1 hypothetical protein [Kiritimatiellia bacterium]
MDGAEIFLTGEVTMNFTPNESDWTLYKKLVAPARERFLHRINQEVTVILSDPERNHTERFWDAFHKMEKDQKILADAFGRFSRSNMALSILAMCRHQMIDRETLQAFSREFREKVEFFLDDNI